ncbi:MAG: cytochrome P450 [Myxococcales bacterium]|nr:cytochrome P450 [Myxococcales bacterium]MDH3485824.1 cytochrome P450 [Myxococcales bacterium]
MRVKPHRPPGPAKLPLIGDCLAFGRDPHGFLLEAASHGPLATLRLFSRPFYLVSSPELVQQGLVHRSRSMRKDDGLFDLIRRALGNGLVTSENPLWRRQRKFMAHAFTPARVELYADKMVDAALGTLSQWSEGQPVELHAEMAEIALEAVSNALFDLPLRRQAQSVFRSMNAIGDFFVEAFASPIALPHWWPSPRNFRFIRACREMDSVVEGIIGERRKDNHDRGDLLSALLLGVHENGEHMSEKQVRDECMTMLIAGHETTGLTLMYTLYLLARHPEIETRVREEIDGVLGGRRATASDLESLALTMQVIKEALRLYPPAWMTARVLIEETELGGYSLPAGSALMFSPWVTHRDPHVFTNPETFDPDRWSPERAANMPRFAFFPFGAGPRACIGNHFAMMELGLILATLLQRCRFELVSQAPIRIGVSATLRPAHEVHARVHLRATRRTGARRPACPSPEAAVRVPAVRPRSGPARIAPISSVPRSVGRFDVDSSPRCPFAGGEAPARAALEREPGPALDDSLPSSKNR